MEKVVDIKEYSHTKAVRRARKFWKNHFPEELTANTYLGDLCDNTILQLAQGREEVMAVIYDLIMGILDLGPGAKFDHLAGKDKMKVLDLALFLIDQIRWECLKRLNWVEGFAAEKYPLVELILDNKTIKADFKPHFPHLSPNHYDYEEFVRRKDIDGEAMIRALIPSALTAFNLIISK